MDNCERRIQRGYDERVGTLAFLSLLNIISCTVEEMPVQFSMILGWTFSHVPYVIFDNIRTLSHGYTIVSRQERCPQPARTEYAVALGRCKRMYNFAPHLTLHRCCQVNRILVDFRSNKSFRCLPTVYT